MHTFSKLFALLALCCAAFAPTHSAWAGPIYRVTGDTTTLNGQQGFLQFSLGGLLDSPSAGLSIRTLDGVLLMDSGSESIGQVEGSLPSLLKLFSQGDYSERLQAVQFGSQLQFLMELDADWATGPNGAGVSFALSLLGSDYTPLLSDDAFGHWLRVDWLEEADLRLDTPGAGLRFDAVHDVPAPNALLLGVAGLLLMVHLGRRTR